MGGPNRTVMGWKKKVEEMWRTHPYSLTRRRKWAEDNDCPGYTTVEDNVGKVTVNFRVTDLEDVLYRVPLTVPLLTKSSWRHLLDSHFVLLTASLKMIMKTVIK